MQVTCNLLRMTSNMRLHWEREESPIIVGLLHDLCKIDLYDIVEDEHGTRIEYDDCRLLDGHGDKSCIIALQYMDLTEEELMCIRYHMGAFAKGEAEAYTRAAGYYPNVIWTHTADMIASQVNGV